MTKIRPEMTKATNARDGSSSLSYLSSKTLNARLVSSAVHERESGFSRHSTLKQTARTTIRSSGFSRLFDSNIIVPKATCDAEYHSKVADVASRCSSPDRLSFSNSSHAVMPRPDANVL